MRAFKLFFALLILWLAPAVLAQADCPAIIASALEEVDSACHAITRNQLCYGNITLNATPRGEAADFQFEQPGDVVGLADVETLQLSSFSLTDEEWGVALMKIQANLPDSLPGQNVTFLFFGDVSMTDAAGQIVEVPVIATSGVNVRALPTTDASVIESLTNGQEVVATGRLPDGSWIRIRLDDQSVGWVSADFVNGDLNRLLSIEPHAPAFGPMQAFYFTTGLGDAPCEQAPDSGILVQTPEGAGTIQLRANNVDIQLGSTVYLQAVPGDAMYVNVIEGHATLTADGETQVVPAGTVARIPLDASGVASGLPEYPETYDSTALQALPLNLLTQEVAVEPGIAENNIPAAIDIVSGLPPGSGQWVHTETITHLPCGQTNVALGSVGTYRISITFNEDRSTMTTGPLPDLPLTLYRSGEATYAAYAPGRGGNWEFIFTSPTTYIGTLVGWRENPGCSLDSTFEGVYQP